MARHTELDLSTMENRMRTVKMTESDRLVAMTAMRNGIMIVDALAWVVQAVAQLGEVFSAKPRLAR